MAVEGKLRMLFVNLDTLSSEQNIQMRPFFKVEIDCKQGQKMTRIEIGMKKGDEPSDGSP